MAGTAAGLPALLPAAPVLVETAPPFSVLLHQPVDRAPALLEQAASLRAARADACQARAWPNPSVSAEFESLAAGLVTAIVWYFPVAV